MHFYQRFAKHLAHGLMVAGCALSAFAATANVTVGPAGTTSFVDAMSGTSTTTIQVGDTVQWTWGYYSYVSVPHSTTSGTCSTTCTPDTTWDSGQHTYPYSYSRVFNTVGTFHYFCVVHTVSMQGAIVVLPPSPQHPQTGPGRLRVSPADQLIPQSTNLQYAAALSFFPGLAKLGGELNVTSSVTWSSSDTNVATIDPHTGLVRSTNIAGTTVITARSGPFVTSVRLTVTAGAPASITTTSGTPQSATISTAFAAPLVATVFDSGGNRVSGVTVTFTAPGSGATGTFAGGVNTAVTNASGAAMSAIFTAYVFTGSYNVAASVSGVAAPANFSLTNTAGAPAFITATSGTSQSSAIGFAFAAPLVATVKDVHGNPVSGVTVTFTAPSTGASGTFAGGVNTAVTNASGAAMSAIFTAYVFTGSYNVAASVSGVATPANFLLTNVVSGVGHITILSGTPQSATINTVFAAALAVRVTDVSFNPLVGKPVTFTAPSSGPSGTPLLTTFITDNSGVAVTGLTANGIAGGPYNVTALVEGMSASFALTNLAGPPVSIIAMSGTSQSATINTAFAAPLAATVKDGGGNPVSGVTVTFTAPGTGASGSFAGGVNTAVTNAGGVATSSTFTANGTAGGPYLVAAKAGTVGPANFSLTNAVVTVGAPASITATSGTPQSARRSRRP